jgi:hypothetical protein
VGAAGVVLVGGVPPPDEPMSVARICDGCGSAVSGPPYEGWLKVRLDDGVRVPSIFETEAYREHREREPIEVHHVCSWPCLAELAMKHADLFAEKKEQA